MSSESMHEDQRRATPLEPVPREVENADVVVLGGGPAGVSASIRCAQAGLRVVLLDRGPACRAVTGETLHPGVFPLLRQLGAEETVLKAGFVRHSGHYVRWNSVECFVPFGEDKEGSWLGLQAWRPDFDAILLARARDLGVRILMPETPGSLLCEQNRVVGIATAKNDIRAAFVIDATGRTRWLARQLSLTVICHGPRRIAWFGYAEGTSAERSEAPALRADTKGWTWTARVRPNVYQWTRINFDNRRPPAGWLPDDLRGLSPQCSTRAVDVTCQMVQMPAGPGYFLIGDAACVLDPASSHGVLKAIMCGIMAGHLIAHIQSAAMVEREAVEGYSAWLREWFHRDVEQLKSLYAQLPSCQPTVIG
jgi:flavin-dependent dehydrogenase